MRLPAITRAQTDRGDVTKHSICIGERATMREHFGAARQTIGFPGGSPSLDAIGRLTATTAPPSSRIFGPADAAAMGFDDRAADREPHPPFRLSWWCRRDRKSVPLRHRCPLRLIAKLDRHHTPVPPRYDRQGSYGVHPSLHRFDRIAEEVEHHLFDLDLDRRPARGRSGSRFSWSFMSLSDSLSAIRPHTSLTTALRLTAWRCDPFLGEERADPADDLCRLVGVPDDRFGASVGAFGDLADRRSASAAHGIGIGNHGLKGLAELVRDRHRELR